MDAANAKNWAQKQKERKKSLRELKKGKSNNFSGQTYKRIFTAILIVALGLPLVAVGVYFYRRYAEESALAVSGNIITVRAGGDFQAALNRAKSGDTIVLLAGAKFVGAFVLPNKTGSEFITIQSSELAKLPPDGTRVSPKDAALMPKILSSGKGEPAILTAPNAHHYRFVGIEFAPDNKDYIYNLISLGAEKANEIPHHIEIDRCYLHSNPSGVTRRGIALNNADTIIKNSHLAGFAGNQEETQAICGWTGTKNVKIINNYLEGGAENVMFGGSDPASADLIPSDIEISGNHFNKPAEWQGKNSMKTLFELKNVKRVQFVGNFLENNWEGSAFRITVRNQDGNAPFSTIEDVTIKDNVIVNSSEGVNILGTDDTHPSQTLKRLTIVNNLFLDIGKGRGAGYFIQISSGQDVTIANNTVFNYGNITTFHGDLPVNFLFRDNIVGHGDYGIHGHPNIKSAAGQKIFLNNVFVNNKGVGSSDTSFPPGNIWVNDYKSVGFANAAQNDFRLAPGSRFKGKGKNGDIGSNLTTNSPAK